MGIGGSSLQMGTVRSQRGHGRARSARGGFTLAEMALAMTILMVALMSISAATLRSHSLRRQNRDRVLAQNEIRSFSERMHALSIAESDDPASWASAIDAAFGEEGTIGTVFDVQGLTPVAPDEGAGFILVVTDETLTDEDVGAELGMPRDLNGDGDALDTDVTDDARLLPVVISVRWTGARGEQRIVHPFYILGY